MNIRSSSSLLGGIGVLALSLGATSLGYAQADILTKEVGTVDYQNVEIGSALVTLLNSVSAKYVIAPSVKGKISARLENVSLQSALDLIVLQVNATYHVQGGVVHIWMLNSPRMVAQGDQPGEIARLTFSDVEVSEALRTLFKSAGEKYVLSPEVRGKVSARAANIPLDSALFLLLRQVNARFKVSEGIYHIFPMKALPPTVPNDPYNPPTNPGAVVGNPTPATMPSMPYPGVPTATSFTDTRYVYVLRGNIITKIRKSDLAVVGIRDINNLTPEPPMPTPHPRRTSKPRR